MNIYKNLFSQKLPITQFHIRLKVSLNNLFFILTFFIFTYSEIRSGETE